MRDPLAAYFEFCDLQNDDDEDNKYTFLLYSDKLIVNHLFYAKTLQITKVF